MDGFVLLCGTDTSLISTELCSAWVSSVFTRNHDMPDATFIFILIIALFLQQQHNNQIRENMGRQAALLFWPMFVCNMLLTSNVHHTENDNCSQLNSGSHTSEQLLLRVIF